jgi:hypothetical protein
MRLFLHPFCTKGLGKQKEKELVAYEGPLESAGILASQVPGSNSYNKLNADKTSKHQTARAIN